MVLLRHITAPSPADAVHYHSATYSSSVPSTSVNAFVANAFVANNIVGMLCCGERWGSLEQEER